MGGYGRPVCLVVIWVVDFVFVRVLHGGGTLFVWRRGFQGVVSWMSGWCVRYVVVVVVVVGQGAMFSPQESVGKGEESVGVGGGGWCGRFLVVILLAGGVAATAANVGRRMFVGNWGCCLIVFVVRW